MKILIYHYNHIDPAIRYESLAKYALGKDHELAKCRTYDLNFTYGASFYGEVKILTQIVDGLIKIEPINTELRLIKEYMEREIAEKTSLGLIDHLIQIIEK